MNGNYRIGDRVFGNWVILSEIGKGSFGKVYVVGHEDDQSITAALKVITVPQDEAEVRMAANEGMDYAELSQHFYGMVQEIENEFKLQFKVKGSGHVVAYEDHKVETHKDAFGRELLGWDILIRMELLTPLLTWAYEHPMTRGDIIRLGIHMCKALEACQVHGILHRDIKPENIFVSATGDYKLGDFGVARTMEKTISNMSKKGTYNYMAPEVYKGLDCNFKADIYSVGIVLYRLLNRNRFPFLPSAPQPVTMRDREQALARRMKGERLPLPLNAQDRLGEIVCKAASYDPAGRHTDAAEMRRELEEALRFEKDERAIYPDAEDLKKRQDVDRMSRTVNPSVTPRMSDRTVHLNQFDNTGWGDDTADDTADKTSSGWGARGGFAAQERTASKDSYFRMDASRQQESVDEPEEMTSSTVSAWSHKTPSGQSASMEDRKQATEEELRNAMDKAKSGAMGGAFDSVRKASREAKEAAKLAKQEKEKAKANRPARNEQEAKEAYERACREKNAKTTERETLENMAITDPVLKSEMMREAAKAEMEAVVRVNDTKRVWDEFRQKRLEEEETKRQEELKRKKEERLKEVERKRQAEEEVRKKEEKQVEKAAKKSLRKSTKSSGTKPLAIVVVLGFAFVIGLLIFNTVNGNIGGSDMANKAVDVAENYWDMFYDSLDVEGELNYRTDTLEEIGEVLDAAGFQFLNEKYERVDEVYVDESSGRRLHAEAEWQADSVTTNMAEVIVSDGGSGSRTIIFRGNLTDFYQKQSYGEIPVFLPTEYVIEKTTTKQFNIDEEMIRWVQSEHDTTVDGWEVYTHGDTDSYGNGECSIQLTNKEENKELYLRFFATPENSDYVLFEVWIQFPEESPAGNWKSITDKLYQGLNLTKQSGINYQADSMVDIVEKLEEKGAYFAMPEGGESPVGEVIDRMKSGQVVSAVWPGALFFIKDEFYDSVITRTMYVQIMNKEEISSYAKFLPVCDLIHGETTMEELGISQEMLDEVKKVDPSSETEHICHYDDLSVYLLYGSKNDDMDSLFINITKNDSNAESEVGSDYVGLELYFELVEDQWILNNWFYSFAMK